MKLEIGQAGSIFAGWIASCLSCSTPADDNQNRHHQQAMNDKGVERDMKICHTQPHLVPPMRLVVYDDLPSPGPPPRAASLPSWVNEGRQLASRASSRASMSFKRKSTVAPLRISAPTDFRRVDTDPFTDSTEFKPLELTIHTPGNHLSNLPSFEEYRLLDEQRHQHHLSRPPRALSPSVHITRSRSHQPSNSFQFPRKPVGSGSRRSSLATLEQLLERQTPITSPLIPHFSSRPSTTAGPIDSLISPAHTRLDSTGGFGSLFRGEQPRRPSDAKASTVPRTPTNLQDRPMLPSTPLAEKPSSIDSNRPPTALSESPNTTPPRSLRSKRVTQWLFQAGNKPSTSPQSTPSHDKTNFRTRTRTLSGSTLASTFTSMTAATVRASSSDARREKEFSLPISRPIPIPNAVPSGFEERTYPTIYEGQQQHQHGNYQDSVYNHYATQRESVVGLAF